MPKGPRITRISRRLLAYIEFIRELNSDWLEANMNRVLAHCLGLLLSPRATNSHAEAVFSRHCVRHILSSLLRSRLSEMAQLTACCHLIGLLRAWLFQAAAAAMSPTVSLGQSTVSSTPALLCMLTSGVMINSMAPGLVMSTSGSGSGSNGAAPPAMELPGSTAAAASRGMSDSTDSNSMEVAGLGNSALLASTSSSGSNGGASGGAGGSTADDQHLLICALDQLTELIRWLESSA
ncbi:unnamed protein product, partial [Protopolystoma xenopodis]